MHSTQQAGLQHLANLRQEDSIQPVRLVHQHHLQALVQVQALEQDRLYPQQQEQHQWHSKIRQNY